MAQCSEIVSVHDQMFQLWRKVDLTHGTVIHILNTIPELCDGLINFRIRLGAVSKIIENVELADEVSFW